MASMKWLAHSVCNVLGNPTNKEETYNNNHEDVKKISLKVPNTTSAGLSHKTEAICPSSGFQMPLHYPHYTKADYEKMEEWRLELLLNQYGLSFQGSLEAKREFAKGAFLWPDQY